MPNKAVKNNSHRVFGNHSHFLVIDVETKKLAAEVGGWEHLDQLGVSLACAFDSKTSKYRSYHEHELGNLIRLFKERVVVGYNISGFDFPVLAPYGCDPSKFNSFDVMTDLEAATGKRWLSLESVALGTLDYGSFSDGLEAVEMWKRGDMDELSLHCLGDVKIILDIFRFGREHGFVRIGKNDKKSEKVSVTWR